MYVNFSYINKLNIPYVHSVRRTYIIIFKPFPKIVDDVRTMINQLENI